MYIPFLDNSRVNYNITFLFYVRMNTRISEHEAAYRHCEAATRGTPRGVANLETTSIMITLRGRLGRQSRPTSSTIFASPEPCDFLSWGREAPFSTSKNRRLMPRKIITVEVVSRLSTPRGVPREAASQWRYEAWETRGHSNNHSSHDRFCTKNYNNTMTVIGNFTRNMSKYSLGLEVLKYRSRYVSCYESGVGRNLKKK